MPLKDIAFSVHLENMKLDSPEQSYPWMRTNGYDSNDRSTKGASGVHQKDEGQNDVIGHDLNESACGELTLDDVVKIKAATAQKSDAFILVAAGSESTQLDKKDLQKKAKGSAGKLSDYDSENTIGTACAKSRSRRVPVFDDVSIIPSSSEPVFYLGRCTTDGFTTSSDDSTASWGDGKCSNMLALVARDNGCGEPGVASKHSGGYEEFRVLNNRSDGCTSSSSSDEGIPDGSSVPTMPCLVPRGRGAHIMQLLGLHEPPKPGMFRVISSPK